MYSQMYRILNKCIHVIYVFFRHIFFFFLLSSSPAFIHISTLGLLSQLWGSMCQQLGLYPSIFSACMYSHTTHTHIWSVFCLDGSQSLLSTQQPYFRALPPTCSLLTEFICTDSKQRSLGMKKVTHILALKNESGWVLNRESHSSFHLFRDEHIAQFW